MSVIPTIPILDIIEGVLQDPGSSIKGYTTPWEGACTITQMTNAPMVLLVPVLQQAPRVQGQ
jgi:hypothetical protein